MVGFGQWETPWGLEGKRREEKGEMALSLRWCLQEQMGPAVDPEPCGPGFHR